MGTGWSWLRIGAGTCEYGDKLSGSKNAGNFLTICKTTYLLKDPAPWSKSEKLVEGGQVGRNVEENVRGLH